MEDLVLGSARPMTEAPFDIDELDAPFSSEDHRPPYRRKMPTIRDFAPLPDEYLPAVRPARRDSLPTLPDIDPLRHDLPS